MVTSYRIDPGASPQDLRRRRAIADALMKKGAESGPIQHWTEGVGRVANAVVGAMGHRKANEAEKAGRSEAAERFSAAVTPFLSGTAEKGADGPATPATDGDYFSSVRSRESGGDDTARNPNSSATGRYQFTEGTWNDLAKRHAGLNLTPDGRTDPDQQERAMQAFTGDNRAVLEAQGIEPTNANLYAAHFLGAGDAPKVLTAPDDAPLAGIIQPESMAANPHLQGMSVGDFKAWAAQNRGGGEPVQTAQAVLPWHRPQGQPQAQTGPDLGGLIELAGDPYLSKGQSAVLNALIEQRLQAMQPRDPIQVGDALLDPDTYQPLYQAPQEAPSSFREYELARQGGYQGSYADWVKSKSPQVNIGQSEYGKIPPGFQLVRDPQSGALSMAPIPGGPAEAEQQKEAEQEAARAEQEQGTANIVVQDVDRALQMIEADPTFTTGFGGFAMSYVPGSPAHNVQKLIETVQANAGFDKLNAMREASPTGGALGQVTERELAFLQAAIGNLEQSQDDEQLKDNLRRVKNIYLDIIHGEGQGPEREALAFQRDRNAAPPPPPGFVVDQ